MSAVWVTFTLDLSIAVAFEELPLPQVWSPVEVELSHAAKAGIEREAVS